MDTEGAICQSLTEGNHGRDLLMNYLQQKLPSKITCSKGFLDDIRKGISMTLGSERPKKVLRPRRKRKLNSKEKTSLGLKNWFRKNDLLYRDFLPMHSLWQGYAAEVLEIARLKDHTTLDSSSAHLMVRVGKLDLHGAQMSVVRSRCSSYVGISGIVFQETRNAFRLITKDNAVKTLLKDGSHFTIRVGHLLVTLFGRAFLSRSVDRATKKFKLTSNTFELAS